VYHTQLKHSDYVVRKNDILKAFDDKDSAIAFTQQTLLYCLFFTHADLTPKAIDVLRKVLADGSIPRDLADKGIWTYYEYS
jgi:hypothetical protein